MQAKVSDSLFLVGFLVFLFRKEGFLWPLLTEAHCCPSGCRCRRAAADYLGLGTVGLLL
jgi:hypothetical protein